MNKPSRLHRRSFLLRDAAGFAALALAPARAAHLLLIAAVVLAAGCIGPRPPVLAHYTVETRKLLTRVKLGMTMTEVLQEIGFPGRARSLVFPYASSDGGYFIFYFRATHEVPEQGAPTDPPTLLAITKTFRKSVSAEGDSRPPGLYEVYLKPDSLSGQVFRAPRDIR